MHKISKLLPYIFIHLAIGLIGSFIFSFFFAPQRENLLPYFLLGWKIREAVLTFIFYFPFLHISALILGCTVIFGKYGPITMQRRSPEMMKFIQSLFIVLIVTVSFYVILSEAVQPILLGKQSGALSQTESYLEYTRLAEDAISRKEYANALQHIQKAAKVWPEGGDAKKIYEIIRISDEELSIKKKDDSAYQQIREINISEKLSPGDALKIAERSMLKFDLYTAHYYAKLAAQTFDDENPLKGEAENLAKKSWSEIEKGLASSLEEPEITFFKNKKQAYEAMLAGDFITAYYSFLQIKNELLNTDRYKIDPELERFSDLAKADLERNTFFTDEIENSPAFSVNKNISFTVGSAEANAEIKIYGIARVADKDNYKIYLMNTEYTYYENNNIKYSIFIPFSKLKRIENTDGGNSLLLQIRPVERGAYGYDICPKIITGTLPEENTYNIILPMKLSDFNLIEDAAHGPTEMKLSVLYAFSLTAEKYGFTKAVYLREILYRLAKPLLLLIISVIAVTVAWIFRLSPETKFKKRWIIVVPLCPFISYLLVGLIEYVNKLLIAFFVSVTPKYVSLITLGMLIVLFICATVSLFYQRSE